MITKQEYGERIVRLQKKVAEAGLEAFIVSSEDNIYYLTGVSYKPFERPFFIIIRPDGNNALLVPSLETAHLKSAPNIPAVHSYWDYPSPAGKGWADLLLDLLDVPAKKGLADRILDFLGVSTRVGVEPAMPQEISAKLGGAKLRALPLLEEMRLVKSPAEVEMIRQAVKYSDMCVANVIKTAYYGVSDLELFAQARPVQMQVMKDTEYEVLTTSILTAAWPAPLSAQPHGVPHLADRLREGPHIALALIRVNGYGAECERTFFTSPPDSAVKDAFAAMIEARNRCFKLVRPGARCSDIDAAGNGYLKEKGYGANLLHRVGHGFGLNNHEGPWLSEGSEDVLAENMLISIEPGIYLPGVGGVRHSDTVLVTRDGYEVLNKYPLDLDSLIIKGYKAGKRLQGWIMRKAVGVK